MKDFDLLVYEGETIYRVSKYRPPALVRQYLLRKKALERIFVLVFLSLMAQAVSEAYLSVALEPLALVNNLVARRFGADQNWVLAVAILATHENLIKKKLIDLGVPETKIEGISRKGGLNRLIGLLEREIETKEKRQVSLEFYKASGLRNVRNKLEHQGYRVKVSYDEMRSLLNDALRFETELYSSEKDI